MIGHRQNYPEQTLLCHLHTSVHFAKRPGKGTSDSLSLGNGFRLLYFSKQPTFSTMSASTLIKISSASRPRKARFRDFLCLPEGKRIPATLRTKMTQITPVHKTGATEGKATPYAKKDTNLAKRMRLTGLFPRAPSPAKDVLPTRFENLI